MNKYLTATFAFASSALLWAEEAAQSAAAAATAATAGTEAGEAVQQAVQSAAQKPQGGMNPMFMMLILLVAMYFLMIAPQRKQRKQREQMMAALKEGDRVMTQSGVYGTIKRIKDDSIRLLVDEQTKTAIEISKNAIATVIQDKAPEKAE